MEEKKDITYIAIRKEIERIIPFDYNGITAEETLSNVKELLKNFGVGDKVPDEALKDMIEEAYRKCKPDQLLIADAHSELGQRLLILQLRQRITDVVNKYCGFEDEIVTTNDIKKEYSEKAGTLEELEELVSRENIENYIKKSVMIEKIDVLAIGNHAMDRNATDEQRTMGWRYYQLEQKLSGYISSDIAQHFGLEKGSREIKDRIWNLITSVVKMKTPYLSKIEEQLPENTNFTALVDHLEYVLKILYEGRKARQPEIDARKEALAQEQTSENFMSQEGVENANQPTIEPVGGDSVQGEIKENYDRSVETLVKIQETIQRQIEIKKELNEIEIRKKKLEEEFKNNEEEIRKGGSNAI